MLKPVAWLILCALSVGAPAGAQQGATSPEPSTSELIEHIIELQRQIDELKAQLSPRALEQLRSRLAAATEAPQPATSADATSSPTVGEPVAVTETAPTPDPTPTSETTAESVVATKPALPPAEVPGPLPMLNRRSQRQACNTLQSLDENGDGTISSQDRYWRHLYLWNDKNRDSQMQEREIASAYDRGVREIAVSLGTFVRTKGGVGEIRLEDQVVLDLRGDGFSDRTRRDDGVLLVDATALRRGAGLELQQASGEPLQGFQPYRSDLRIQDSEGRTTALNCP